MGAYYLQLFLSIWKTLCGKFSFKEICDTINKKNGLIENLGKVKIWEYPRGNLNLENHGKSRNVVLATFLFNFVFSKKI